MKKGANALLGQVSRYFLAGKYILFVAAVLLPFLITGCPENSCECISNFRMVLRYETPTENYNVFSLSGSPRICPNTTIGKFSLRCKIAGSLMNPSGTETFVGYYYDKTAYFSPNGWSEDIYVSEECIPVADVSSGIFGGASKVVPDIFPGVAVYDPSICSGQSQCALYTAVPGQAGVRLSKEENACRGLIEVSLKPMILPDGTTVCINCWCGS